jgi:hypothetical protein
LIWRYVVGVVRQVDIGAGEAVLVDELGAHPLLTAPAAEDAVLLDLGGSLNRTDQRWEGRFLMAPGHAAELVAELMTSGAAFSSWDQFAREVAEHVARLAREDRDGG